MTTTHPTEAPEFAGVACPPWCTLAGRELNDYATDSGHGDGPLFPGDDAGEVRVHSGPRFGDFLTGEAEEYAAAPGVLSYYVAVHTTADGLDATRPSELLDLAVHVLEAAKWLEAHR